MLILVDLPRGYMVQNTLNTHIKPGAQVNNVAHGPLVYRMIYASFCWNWRRGSGEEDENVKKRQILFTKPIT